MTVVPFHHPKVEGIVEEVLAEIGIGYYADRDTGEINQTNLTKFLDLEDALRLELYRKANVYRSTATKIRRENKMRPFSWALETNERIRHYVQTEKWQLPELKKNQRRAANELTQPTRQDNEKRPRKIYPTSDALNRAHSQKT